MFQYIENKKPATEVLDVTEKLDNIFVTAIRVIHAWTDILRDPELVIS